MTTQQPRGSRRTLEGYRVEFDIARREGKPWTARKAADAARRLAEQLGEWCPEWARGGQP